MNMTVARVVPGARFRALAIALILPIVACAQQARAAEVNVTATFTPSALDPSRNTFTNTTPRGTYCTWSPWACARANAYFFDVPLGITKTYVKGGDIRKRFYVGFPGPRRIQLQHSESGQLFPVDIAFQAVSGRLEPGNGDNPVFTKYPQGGCSYIHTAGLAAYVNFGWLVRSPDAPVPCHSTGGGASGFTQTYTMPWFGIGLNITAPSPLSMPNGQYEGSVTYTVGSSGADIDLGDDVTSDPELTLRFRFSVAHEFQVTFPSTSPIAVLSPVGGWQQWIDYGRAPSRLQQELPFTLTSSSDFSVKMRCEHEVSGRCGIEDLAAGTIVPVDVDVTMPGMRVIGTGAPAINTSLVSDASGTVAPRFTPDSYLVSRPSKLVFSANGTSVTEMLKAPSSRWQGDVTVVFDSDL